MANSYNTYVANGSQTAFLVTFEQRVFTQIQVYLNSELQTSGYTYNSVTKQIVFDTAPPIGVIVRLQRYTSEVLLNKFGQDAAFTGSNLDENFEQILFKAEETQEAWLAPLDRAVRVPNSEVSINALPNVANRRNKALGFDSNGQPFMIPLVNIPDSALAIALAMTDGGKWIGTLGGGTFLDRQDTVCLSEFTNNTGYASISAAVQACFDYAAANGKVVDARGWVGSITGTVTMTNIEVVGGTWNGTGDLRVANSTFRDFLVTTMRVAPWGGLVRILNGEINGKPSINKVASIIIRDQPTEANIEIDGVVFRNGLYGILQQGGGALVKSGVFRNLMFFDMGGDAIELNVVPQHYDDGCVIENIYMDNIDSTDVAPIQNSNWGIGIGVAGSAPYGIDAPDSTYAKNITVRNIHGSRVRQVVHFEKVRDSVIENVHANPDQRVSNGAGLIVSTVLCYGSRRITIDGVQGEPVVTGSTQAKDVRVVMLEWGANPQVGAVGPTHDVVLRNVTTRTGRVYAQVGVEKAGYHNRYTMDGIDCYTLSVTGIATELNMSNVRCHVFDCRADDSNGGSSSNGYQAEGMSILRMVNVQANDDNGHAGQGWSRCGYSHVESIGSNVHARLYPRRGIDGGIGVRLATSNMTYIIPTGETMNYENWDGNAFPTGREFIEGDLVLRNDGKFYTVTTSGAYIPDDDNASIKETSVGNMYVESNTVYNGNKYSLPWFYVTPYTPGTRITIPGAGAGGADLNTWITTPPENTSTGVPSSPVRMGIAHPIATVVPAGTRIRATVPVAFRTPS